MPDFTGQGSLKTKNPALHNETRATQKIWLIVNLCCNLIAAPKVKLKLKTKKRGQQVQKEKTECKERMRAALALSLSLSFAL